jgi:hypothetical protein
MELAVAGLSVARRIPREVLAGAGTTSQHSTAQHSTAQQLPLSKGAPGWHMDTSGIIFLRGLLIIIMMMDKIYTYIYVYIRIYRTGWY